MPAYLVHFCILDMAFSKANRDLQEILRTAPTYHALPKGQHTPICQWAYLGSLGPDLAYVPAVKDEVEWIADAIHWKKSNSFVANWIENLDMEPFEEGESINMHLAFLFGFLSHMAADSIIHPYVNMFAGVVDDLSIKVATEGIMSEVSSYPYVGALLLPVAVPLSIFKPQKAHMHRFVELHQDSYVAKQYYGVESLSAADPLLSNSPPSWNSFIEMVDSDSYRNQFNALMDRYEEVTIKTYPYGKKADSSELKKAVEYIKNRILAWYYDGAMGYMPDHTEELFVQHPKRDRPYESYLWAAAYTSVKYWEAAYALWHSDFLEPVEDRKKFFKVVRNFDLDTGFAPRVYSTPSKIYIRHEHSWNILLDEPTQAYDPEKPPDIDNLGRD